MSCHVFRGTICIGCFTFVVCNTQQNRICSILLRVARNTFGYHLLRVKCSELLGNMLCNMLCNMLRNMFHNMLSQLLRRVKAPLQNCDITSNAHVRNYNTRECGCIHTFKVKHEIAKECLKYKLPKLINDTPERVN